MKKIKKVVALLTVALFLFAFTAPAAMASVNVDDSTTRLNGLGIVQGYPDGTFGLDKNITRAEFAVIADKLMGLGDAVDGAKGTTKFKDVPASHWASGAINLAVGNGVIKGYPDGTFRPDANVSLAEATAMLVQVLGYGPSLQGVWPNNVMGKGAEVGVLKGVSVANYNAAATRGTVFLAADNCLDIDVMKQTSFGTDPKWEVQDKTLIEDKLSVVKVKDATIDSTSIVDTALDQNEVKVSTPDGTYDSNYTVTGAFDANNMLGLKGTAWLDTKNDNIIFFQADDTVVNDYIKTAPGANSVTLKIKNDTYTLASDAKVYLNYKANKDVNGNYVLTGINAGDEVKAVISNSEIKDLFAFDLNSGIVDRVDSANEKIYLSAGSSTITLADNYNIFKDGKAATLADVQQGDVVQWANDSNSKAYYLLDSTKVLTGTLDNVATDDSWNIQFSVGGTNVKTAKDVQYSTNDGQDYNDDLNADVSKMTDFDGQTVTAYLNAFGKVAFFKTGSTVTVADNVALVKEFTTDTGADGANNYVRVMKTDGTETYYKINDDTTINSKPAKDTVSEDPNGYYYLKDGDGNGASDLSNPASTEAYQDTTYDVNGNVTYTGDVRPGMVVKLDLSSDGTTVDNFKLFNTKTEVITGTAEYSSDNATVTVNNGSTAKLAQVQDDTAFFTVKNWESNAAARNIKDAKFITWGDVKGTYDESNFSNATVTLVYDSAKAEYVFINASVAVTSDKQVGIISAKGITGSDLNLSIVLPGSTSTVKYNWDSNLATKTLVYFSADSDNKVSANDFGIAAPLNDAGTATARYYVKSIASGVNNTKLVTLRTWDDTAKTYGNTNYTVIVKDGYTTYFNADSTPVKVDGLNVGDHVKVFDLLDKDGKYTTTNQDGIVDFVVVKDKP